MFVATRISLLICSSFDRVRKNGCVYKCMCMYLFKIVPYMKTYMDVKVNTSSC
jgi:hypothetical protein